MHHTKKNNAKFTNTENREAEKASFNEKQQKIGRHRHYKPARTALPLPIGICIFKKLRAKISLMV
jgi:hypothetical protein